MQAKDLTDITMLCKYKSVGMTDKAIAAKLGLTEAQVTEKWSRLLQVAESHSQTGYLALVQQFTVMAHQYQLIGESLKIVAGAVGNIMQVEEIKPLITSNQEETLKNLIESCIILKPFVPVNPEESLKESIKRQVEGN